MVVVLTVISGVAGLGLAALKTATAEKIELQELKFGQIPALKNVFVIDAEKELYRFDNDPAAERKKLEMGDEKKSNKLTVFPLKKDGKLFAVAFQTTGKGYGGDIGVVVCFDIDRDGRITGVGVSKQQETTGFADKGQRLDFLEQFRDKPYEETGLGKGINSISGATISSTVTVRAVKEALEIYKVHKQEIINLFK